MGHSKKTQTFEMKTTMHEILKTVDRINGRLNVIEEKT